METEANTEQPIIEELDFADIENITPEEAIIHAHKQILKLIDLVGQQNTLIENLSNIASKHETDSINFRNQIIDLQGKVSTSEYKIYEIENKSIVRTSTGNNVKTGQAVQEMIDAEHRKVTSGYYDMMIASFESVRLMFGQLPESDRAEILSKMASKSNEPMPTWMYNLPFNSYNRILEEAANIVGQPTSILSFYK